MRESLSVFYIWRMGGAGGVKGDRILREMHLLLLETLSHNTWRELQWNYYDQFYIFLLRWCNINNNFNLFYLFW